ncbi:MAG: tyrosine-type recombinase/integrase [Pseudomonadota bacterium]
MPKLTKRTVDAAKARETDYFIFDSELPGFGIRVLPTGQKSYMIQYRVKGRTRRVTFGRHGPMTPEKARKKAIELLSEVLHGKDPSAALRRERNALSVADLGKRFLDDYAASHCKPSTQYEYRRAVELFINPAMGQMKIHEIDRADVAKFHHDLRDIPYQANRALGVLSKMFNMAEVWGLRADSSNPCRHVKKYQEEKRERFLSPEEIQRLGQALREVEAEGSETPAAIAAIRLLLLTGCRLSEILTLKWDYIGERIRLPDSKTGAKTVYIGDAVREVLNAIERDPENPYVIRGRLPGAHLTDLQRPWRRIRKRAKLEGVRLHDLRHSYASGAIGLGESLPIVGKLLGHTQPSTTQRYVHVGQDPAQAAAEKVSESLAGFLSSGKS